MVRNHVVYLKNQKSETEVFMLYSDTIVVFAAIIIYTSLSFKINTCRI